MRGSGLRFIPSLLVLLVVGVTVRGQERLPQNVTGSWRITRVLSMRPTACWTEAKAQSLVGSTLHYRQTEMRWQGGAVSLSGVTTRTVSPELFAKENSGPAADLTLQELGIRSRDVLEVDMQHDDMDITGATTEVPGDAVLVAGPGRLVVSACGVYLEARRLNAGAGSETSGTGASVTAKIRKGF